MSAGRWALPSGPCASLPRLGSSSLGSPVTSSLAFPSTALASPVSRSPRRLVRGLCTHWPASVTVRAHMGGAWPLRLPHGQEQGQAQSRCSVYTGERTNGLSVKGARWQASRQARQPQDAHLSSPLSYNSPEQARFLGLQAFAHAVSSAGQLLPFRIEHRWALTGNTELRGGLRGVISLPCMVSARQVPFSSCRREPGPCGSRPGTQLPHDWKANPQRDLAVAISSLGGLDPGQRWTGPEVTPLPAPGPGQPYPGCRNV